MGDESNMQLKELKCPNCGARLVPKSQDDKIVVCDYCGTVVYLEEEKKVIYVEGVSQKDRGETELALMALRGGNFKDAKFKFESAISDNVNNNVAWVGKASADLHLGNLNEATMAFQKVMELNSDIEMVITWGNYLISTANYYANRYYNMASDPMVISTGQSDGYYRASKAYQDFAFFIRDEIFRYYMRKLVNDELNKSLLIYGLQLAFVNKKYGELNMIADKILSKDPGNISGRYYKGVAQLYLGNYNATIEYLQPLTKEIPQNYNVYIYLAYGYARIGNYQYACDLLMYIYRYYQHPHIASALSSIYGDWLGVDRYGAKNWRNSRKRDLKALHLAV